MLFPCTSSIHHPFITSLLSSLDESYACLPTPNPLLVLTVHLQTFNYSINQYHHATPRPACFCPAPYSDMRVIQLSSSVAERTYLFLTCRLAGRQANQAGVTPYYRKLTSESHYVTFLPEKKNCNAARRSVLRPLQNNLASVGYTNWVRPVTTLRLRLAHLLSCPVFVLSSPPQRLTPPFPSISGTAIDDVPLPLP
jgi:hypothetical protein